MPIPDYETLMLPILKLVSDQKDHANTEIEHRLCEVLGFTDEERTQLLPSGQKRVIYDRVNWARYYMLRAGLVDFPKRGLTRITQRGLLALAANPTHINGAFLSQYPEFVEFTHLKGNTSVAPTNGSATKPPITSSHTPEESLQYAYQEILDRLARDVTDKIKACSPTFFETLVIDLLVKMGYGGSEQDAAQVLGKSGDEGIDGTIKEDPLGLDFIYVQAKRWEGKVGRPDLQKFVGALHGQNARKGVFITTSEFTPEAKSYADSVATKVVLIDGRQLSSLMIRHNVGVSTARVYEMKRIDSDYFEES